MPAIQRYDGPAFRLLRKYLRARPIEAEFLDVYILSAKYGLIKSNHPIANYEQRLTLQKTETLRPQVLAGLQSILGETPYSVLFLSMSKTYLLALRGYEALLPASVRASEAEGTQGRKLSLLFDWLYGNPPNPPVVEKMPRQERQGHPVVIRGVELTLSPGSIFDIARIELEKDIKSAKRYQSWYVEVDDHCVGPKWLVSQISGLPVSAFTTSEARRVLAQLGVEVKRK